MTELNHDDIRWRVSNTWDKGDTKMGMLVGYIDARTCMDALDELDPNWSALHGDPIIVGNELLGVPCALTVNGITRSDVGMPSSQEPIKGAYSDALKRAAVHHNVGRELYELPKIAVACEVDSRGKVKGPKALPIYRNGRWSIDRQYGWVKYDREPDEQPERSRGGSPSSPRASAPASNQYRRGELAELMQEHHLSVAAVDAMAKQMNISERPMSDESMDRLIEAIESERAGSAPLSAPSTPPADSDAAATAAAPAPPSGAAAGTPSFDDILAASGGEEVPPKPGTPEYRALPSGAERAKARAYWDRQKPQDEQESLAVALGAPES